MTTVRQSPLSWAFFSSCFHVSPHCLMSVSRSLRQVFFRLPLFLVPSGFHLRACLVMLVVGFRSAWPIHPHLLLLISSSTGGRPALCQRSLLLIVSGQRILKILLKQLLMNVCTFIVVGFVVLHVSDPYNSTVLTFEPKSFVRWLISLELQMFLGWMNRS